MASPFRVTDFFDAKTRKKHKDSYDKLNLTIGLGFWHLSLLLSEIYKGMGAGKRKGENFLLYLGTLLEVENGCTRYKLLRWAEIYPKVHKGFWKLLGRDAERVLGRLGNLEPGWVKKVTTRIVEDMSGVKGFVSSTTVRETCFTMRARNRNAFLGAPSALTLTYCRAVLSEFIDSVELPLQEKCGVEISDDVRRCMSAQYRYEEEEEVA